MSLNGIFEILIPKVNLNSVPLFSAPLIALGNNTLE